MNDISSRKDIKFIIVSFYDKLLSDDEMLPFFKEFSEENLLETHLETITDFWEDILFDKQQYKSNLLQKHTNTHSLLPFTITHFAIWMSYFLETIDENFSGINAEQMKNRANSIATVMKIKMKLYA
jgi:hemoglobin